MRATQVSLDKDKGICDYRYTLGECRTSAWSGNHGNIAIAGNKRGVNVRQSGALAQHNTMGSIMVTTSLQQEEEMVAERHLHSHCSYCQPSTMKSIVGLTLNLSSRLLSAAFWVKII